MTWIALLLADLSPCLRYRVLTELLDRPDDDQEVIELFALRQTDQLLLKLFKLQASDGSWGPGDLPGSPHNRILTTAQALMQLGYLGFDKSNAVIAKAAEFLFDCQLTDGGWPLSEMYRETAENETYDMIPLQTALPLLGLSACGYAEDPRSERAYDWLLQQRLDDSAWPTGVASGSLGRVAGYRRLPHSRWGCRANTTAALCCLANHPHQRHSEPAQRGLDLLLGVTAQEASNLGFEVARLLGFEPFRGFFTYFARFDSGLVLWLCSRIGATTADQRITRLVDFIKSQQGPYGLWTYRDQPLASRWVTFDLLRSLKEIDEAQGWVSLEPPISFSSKAKAP